MKALAGLVVASGLALGATDARAHCDAVDGPVAKAIQKALETGNINGLKAAGIDYGPMIPAAERALETGELLPTKSVLIDEINHVLGERLAHRDLRKASSEPSNYAQVAAARERISAELGFITFAEGLREAVLAKTPGHHED